jgi:beta-1,2-mannobiose phosphorylase / 1,2-beta-oligomannan phosphorylase
VFCDNKIMTMKAVLPILILLTLFTGCTTRTASENANTLADSSGHPREILDFAPIENNPVFTGTGSNTWDQKIRERGYIIREDGLYHMWYTGFREEPDTEMHLGYATSLDGLVWTRYADNPIFDEGWVEDMMVVKSDGTYYMFAEGKDDIAHLLTSSDRVHWKEHGPLDIRYVNGTPLSKGAYGTPTAWLEDGVWYLFYERGDLGIWLATSTDMKVWTNKQDEPVIQIGPETYDKYGVAVNQIIKHKGKYYAYYHATAFEDWHEWTSCVAISEDLVHWKKYENNPIMKENKSSPILVHDGEQYRLYTMHDAVCVHIPEK